MVRRQRRADGTFSLEGTRFEIPGRYRRLANVHVRYARWDLSRVDLVDPQDGAVLCAVQPLDKAANANGVRRRLGLRQTLCDHAAGNYRILMTLAGELLTVAARRDLGVLDEKRYLDVFAQPDTQPQRRAAVR